MNLPVKRVTDAMDDVVGEIVSDGPVAGKKK
jgi:hypothetical protein